MFWRCSSACCFERSEAQSKNLKGKDGLVAMGLTGATLRMTRSGGLRTVVELPVGMGKRNEVLLSFSCG